MMLRGLSQLLMAVKHHDCCAAPTLSDEAGYFLHEILDDFAEDLDPTEDGAPERPDDDATKEHVASISVLPVR